MTKREFLDIVFALAPTEANAIMDAFDEYVDSNEPHWIPVTERLPEIETDVLLTAWDGKRCFVGWVDAFGKWYSDDEEVNEGYEPIAWCALPEAYKPTVPSECEGDCGWCKPTVIEKCKGVTT